MRTIAVVILLLVLLSCAARIPAGDAQAPTTAQYLPLLVQAGPTDPRKIRDEPPVLRVPDETYLPLIHYQGETP
jgi:hypothetical protein